MRFKSVLGWLIAAVLALPGLARADDLPPRGAAHAVDALIAAMNSYVDPEVGAAVAAALRAQRPVLVTIGDRQVLADRLTDTLQSVGHDQHLRVSVQTISADAAPTLSDEEEALLEGRLAHGLMAVRRLPANIGYLKLRYFAADQDGAALIDAAMAMLKDTDALIIDLRENTGGGGAGDERLLGHLSATPVPMEIIHWRQADGTFVDQQRQVSVPATGPLYPDKPVFLLTARRTFSAAEAFAYGLQAVGRATLVGEATRGGANPSNRPVVLGAGLGAFIPNGRVEHPVTHGNWEGAGVQPDLPTAPDQALTEAFRRALAVARPTVETPKSRRERDEAIADPAGVLAADQAL